MTRTYLVGKAGFEPAASASRMRIRRSRCQVISANVLLGESPSYRSRLSATARNRSFAHGTRTGNVRITN